MNGESKMQRRILWLIGLSLGFLSLTASAQDKRSAKVFLGPTQVTNTDGSTGQGVTLGYHSAAGGKKVAGMWGIEFLGVDIQGSDAFFPVFTLEGGLHMTPIPQAVVVPYANLEIGASFLFLFIPAPSLGIDLGAQIPMGSELKFDLALQARAAANPFNGQTVGITTLALGLGF
jgi:hypothetical protein